MSTKPSFSCCVSSTSSTCKTGGGGGEDVASAARVATGRGSMSGEYLGRRMPYGTTNPS